MTFFTSPPETRIHGSMGGNRASRCLTWGLWSLDAKNQTQGSPNTSRRKPSPGFSNSVNSAPGVEICILSTGKGVSSEETRFPNLGTSLQKNCEFVLTAQDYCLKY